MIHVEECRASEHPEIFADIIEDISAYLLEPASMTEKDLVLSPHRARELILAESDVTDDAMRRIEAMLKLLHFATGWLGNVEAQELQEEITDELDTFWLSLGRTAQQPDLMESDLEALTVAKDEICQRIRNLPMQKIREDSEDWQSKFRYRLPQNYAQLDEKPAEEVVSYMISCLDEADRREIERLYPRGFWSKLDGREEGALAGFAFMLFWMGLIREKHVKKGDPKCRSKRFLGQFRDCNHIEMASRCAMFVTFDKRAARLAKAVYSYAGVPTQVVHPAV